MGLKERFYQVLSCWIDNETFIGQQWEELSEKYTQSFRKYHNLNHLQELFKYFDAYKNELEHPNEMAFSIFYHDIIYSIWSKKNELNSAKLATEYLLNSALDDSGIERVFNLIMVTKNHTPNKNKDEKWMIDFDIGILGQPYETYLQYTQHIRDEYAAIPNSVYKKGRKKVLSHFLNKSKIYQTDTFYNLFEMNARNNIKKELDTL
ncbi:HD domain-containing protein [Thalassobellus citreus]|uniref:HD domain-containing protein n=1 Tax=Thalassobellus citreus TaxID=3367752 RepID=UPI0037A99B22